MRPVTRALFRILNNETLRPVEFLDIRLLGTKAASTIYLTGAGEETAWNGHTYTPVTMSRGGYEDILSSDSGENPAMTINIGNVDRQMAALLNEAELEGAVATLHVADRRLVARPRDAMLITSGEVRDPQLSGQALTFQIVSVIGMLERVVVPRRLWQKQCNYTFGSRPCGMALNESPTSISSRVQAGTTARYIVISSDVLTEAGNPADPSEFWAHGYVLLTSGRAATQARPIHYYDLDEETAQHRIYLRYPLLVAPAADDKVVIRRGCRKSKADCKNRQGHTLNYGGFAEVPYGRIKPDVVSDF